MDDLALFAENELAIHNLLSPADDFLHAYGMSFNASKCFHTSEEPKAHKNKTEKGSTP